MIQISRQNAPRSLKFLPHLRRSGRGILKGAAFRQRPLSRLLLNVLAGTRTLPPEEPAPEHSLKVDQKHLSLVLGQYRRILFLVSFLAACFPVPEPQENCLRESLTVLQKSIIMQRVRFSRKLPELHIIQEIFLWQSPFPATPVAFK